MRKRTAYAEEMRFDTLDPEAFLDFYTVNGWVQSKGKKIQDWKAALRNWNRFDFGNHASKPSPSEQGKFVWTIGTTV